MSAKQMGTKMERSRPQAGDANGQE
jgi:hypothetical protein